MMNLAALKDLLDTITLLAMLAVAYGLLSRSLGRQPAELLLGALFGGAAVLAMADPVTVSDGVIIDLRHVPIVLAGAFLGWRGAAVAASAAMAARMGIGGIGMVAGVVGILASGAVGLAWARLARDKGSGSWRLLPVLAVGSTLASGSIALLPWDIASRLVWTILPYLVVVQMVGVLVVGALLERERTMVSERTMLGDAACRDPLTGLLNRRGFEERIAQLPFAPEGDALFVLDLDRFKAVNDTHGHAAGDEVLRAVARRVAQAARRGDVLARFGGEELVLYMPNVTLHQAQAAAERLCRCVRADPVALPGGLSVPVTTSLGGAWTSGDAGAHELIKAADDQLYLAKSGGRDGWRLAVLRGPVAGSGPEPRDEAWVRSRAAT